MCVQDVVAEVSTGVFSSSITLHLIFLRQGLSDPGAH